MRNCTSVPFWYWLRFRLSMAEMAVFISAVLL